MNWNIPLQNHMLPAKEKEKNHEVTLKKKSYLTSYLKLKLLKRVNQALSQRVI